MLFQPQPINLYHPENTDSFTRDGPFTAYLRGRAVQCKRGQAGIDLVIPMINLGTQDPMFIGASDPLRFKPERKGKSLFL